jgi:hypothetical protein
MTTAHPIANTQKMNWATVPFILQSIRTTSSLNPTSRNDQVLAEFFKTA